jgi:hypothetical protein
LTKENKAKGKPYPGRDKRELARSFDSK